MAETPLTRIIIPMPDELIDRIEDYRRVHQRMPSRSEAIRQLIALGLDMFALLAAADEQPAELDPATPPRRARRAPVEDAAPVELPAAPKPDAKQLAAELLRKKAERERLERGGN